MTGDKAGTHVQCPARHRERTKSRHRMPTPPMPNTTTTYTVHTAHPIT